MCSVFGVITNGVVDSDRIAIRLSDMLYGSTRRGRDGLGAVLLDRQGYSDGCTVKTVSKAGTDDHNNSVDELVHAGARMQCFTMIGNSRAEPTTEWVKDKRIDDQQPYRCGGWTIVHNGTIANDRSLRTHLIPTNIDSAAIAEYLAFNTPGQIDSSANIVQELLEIFSQSIAALKGSYAILATHDLVPGFMFIACNYRPLWYTVTASGFYIASEQAMLPHDGVPVMIQPYSVSYADASGPLHTHGTLKKDNRKALVIASGGMDSTVAAKLMVDEGYDVTLINFQYGCRAESNELKAIRAIATAMDVPLVLFPIPIYDPKDSPLFDANAEIAGGEAGAEFAHEWVPARNLVMLSVATAYAEANGFGTIVLGNNMEEAGAYPDNEPEFINRFNAMLPFAVGDGKRVRVLMPVGNLMKHEIVALGLEHGAPLDLTWSCYKNGDLHCGTCGPCMMRRTAFSINNAPEVITYLDETYEKDDGPLSEEQVAAIRNASSATGIPDSKFNKRLI